MRLEREALIETLAHMAHEANHAYCIALGDDSQLTWEEAPEWQRSSCINGVRGVLEGNGPEESHVSWMLEKALGGWTYGAVKNAAKKEHPCFVPYAELPKEQKVKDAIFVGVVRAGYEAIVGAPL